MYETIDLIVLPRQTLNQEDFLAKPQCSIALDGVVRGGPFRDEETRHVNFDHHDGVDREITMSTCKQVFMAIKGGLFKSYRQNGKPFAYVYVNDSDQDTSLSVFELENNKMLEGSQSNPLFNRLLELTDKLDITGGAFPLNLSDKLMRQHSWIFQPYSELRKSGALATANHQVIQDNIESIMLRIKEYLMNRGGEAELDIRHKILYDSPYGYRIIHEIGGNDARYYLFGNGMDAFVSLVAERPDGKKVWSIGRRSGYIPFPVQELYDEYNKAEGLTRENGWNGSTLVGGSSRFFGSILNDKDLRYLTDEFLEKKYGKKV